MSEEVNTKQEYHLSLRDPSVFEKIKDRKIIFLETSVWIDLADEKSTQSKPVKDLLRNHVKTGKAFCPLSEVIMWELYKQEFNSMLRVGELMEELSLNVSFARKEEIFRAEIKRFILRDI